MAGAALSPAWVVYQLNKAAAAISNARPAWRPPKTLLQLLVASCLLRHQQRQRQRQASSSLPLWAANQFGVCQQPFLSPFPVFSSAPVTTFILFSCRICRHGALFNDTIRATPTHANWKRKMRTELASCLLLLLLNWCPSDRNWRKNVTSLHSLDMHRSSQQNVKLAARLSTHQSSFNVSLAIWQMTCDTSNKHCTKCWKLRSMQRKTNDENWTRL